MLLLTLVASFTINITIAGFWLPFSVEWSSEFLSGKLFSTLYSYVDSVDWFEGSSPLRYAVLVVFSYLTGLIGMLIMQMVISIRADHPMTAPLIVILLYFVTARVGVLEPTLSMVMPGSQLIVAQHISLGFALWPVVYNWEVR